MNLFELLFYNQEKVEIIVDGEEIKEYDSISKIKRFSLIYIKNYEITVNGISIDLKNFINQKNYEQNSFQLSFYDISKNFIVSKRIMKFSDLNFKLFYENYINHLRNYSNDLDLLCKNETEFEKDCKSFYSSCFKIYKNISNDLNLILPKNEMENLLNNCIYLEFFYFFLKIHIFYIFYTYNKKEISDLNQIYNFFGTFFKKLEKEKDYKIYEKISILFHFAEVFNETKLCKTFLEANFHYIKIDTVSFLNDYIEHLNEESPSYFKLIEINSGYGYYKGKKLFTYDMIDLSDLKNHLKELMPSVICFYSSEKIDNFAFTCPAIIGICVNESKLFEKTEKFKLDKNYLDKKSFEVKNVAMKLVIRMKNECFGQIKYSFHPNFNNKKLSSTPKKCFDNHKLKKLVGINNAVKKNTINILSDNHKSDTGNYFESSFGKLSGTKLYTFVYLKQLQNIGNLLYHPELFYQKENLIKLQKFAYYKYFYEKENEKEKENEDDDKEKENEKGKEDYKSFSFEEELEFLNNFYKGSFKDLNIDEKVELPDILMKEKRDIKLISNKRKRTNSKNENIIQIKHKKEKKRILRTIKKKKNELNKIMDREKLHEILSKNNLTFEQQKYYLELYLEATHLN